MSVYDLLFKRSSTFAITIIASAFFFERTLDLASNSIYESVNKGVSFFEKSYVISSEPMFSSLTETMEGHQTQVRGGSLI